MWQHEKIQSILLRHSYLLLGSRASRFWFPDTVLMIALVHALQGLRLVVGLLSKSVRERLILDSLVLVLTNHTKVWVVALLLNSLLHLGSHQHISSIQIPYNRLWISHISQVLPRGESLVAISNQAAHTTCHVLILHPLRINRSPLSLSFFTSFEHCYMIIEGHSTITVVFRAETSAFVASWPLAFPLPIRIMLMARVLAQAFQVLRSNYS